MGSRRGEQERPGVRCKTDPQGGYLRTEAARSFGFAEGAVRISQEVCSGLFVSGGWPSFRVFLPAKRFGAPLIHNRTGRGGKPYAGHDSVSSFRKGSVGFVFFEKVEGASPLGALNTKCPYRHKGFGEISLRAKKSEWGPLNNR